MRTFKITYTETVTEEDLRAMFDSSDFDSSFEPSTSVEDLLEEYLWTECRPRGDDFVTEEITT